VEHKLVISEEELIAQSKNLGVTLTNKQVGQLQTYAQLLQDFNEHTNLVSNAEPSTLLYDHFLDSLSLVPLLPNLPEKKSLIDIGTGAGFPGLVLAIACPELLVTLVETTEKKCRFLQEVVDQLKLNDRVVISNSRAEIIAHERKFRARFDYATCRAVGGAAMVCELTLPFLKKKGTALMQRSNRQWLEESKKIKTALAKLGAQIKQTIEVDQSILKREHCVVVLEKISFTDLKCPRPWTKIKTEPLF
jgi:16S rRNA (guanine527-N7)-methyltransferase